MWQVKTFKTQESMNKWIAKNKHKYQIDIIYVNNAYAVEYRPLKRM